MLLPTIGSMFALAALASAACLSAKRFAATERKPRRKVSQTAIAYLAGMDAPGEDDFASQRALLAQSRLCDLKVVQRESQTTQHPDGTKVECTLERTTTMRFEPKEGGTLKKLLARMSTAMPLVLSMIKLLIMWLDRNFPSGGGTLA